MHCDSWKNKSRVHVSPTILLASLMPPLTKRYASKTWKNFKERKQMFLRVSQISLDINKESKDVNRRKSYIMQPRYTHSHHSTFGILA